jgi:GTP-binding protein
MAVKLPIVSIVGRQNVGKSTLFNALIKDKKSIVDSFPGLTRDIISNNILYNDISFTICDTPGLDLTSASELSETIIENAKNHLKKTDVIIFIMEYPAPTPFDYDLAEIVRKMNKPTIIAANKMDSGDQLEVMTNFYEMGIKEIIPVSAVRRFNINLLLDNIIKLLPAKKNTTKGFDLKITIVGRPNSGKSTLLNAFMGYERSVVSDIPGTTRDSVDDFFTFHGKNIQIIDTAGIRRKSKINENIEFYSFTRTVEAIRRSDVVIHLIDAVMGLTDNDKKISDEIIKARKPIIIALNKWDAVKKNDKTFDQFKEKLIFQFYKAEDFPIISISAIEKKRINKLLETAITLKDNANKRIDTPTLNKIMAGIKNLSKIPQLGEKIKVYYAVQIDTTPPQFKFFVNNAEFFKKDIIRYFEKELQKAFQLEGIPIIIHIEGKKKREKNSRK